MSTPRFAVALVAAIGAMTTSVQPTSHGQPSKEPSGQPAAASLEGAPSERRVETAWPPPSISPAAEPADIEVRLERTARGTQRLVAQKTGTFMHLRYRDVASGGPDWAAIELRPGDRAPLSDVAVWESTEPRSLATRRGLVRFSLGEGARPEAAAAEPPRLGPRTASSLRTCQSHDDAQGGFAVVCRIGQGTSAVRAIRPAAKKPLSRAWVWDVPRSGKEQAARFVRIDLPLSPGGADAGAIAYVHGGRGVVLRAEATWPSAAEEHALVFTEASRAQPVSPFFDWSGPRPRGRR